MQLYEFPLVLDRLKNNMTPVAVAQKHLPDIFLRKTRTFREERPILISRNSVFCFCLNLPVFFSYSKHKEGLKGVVTSTANGE